MFCSDVKASAALRHWVAAIGTIREGSSRQCCESSKVQVLAPSIACSGRLVYPVRAEATKHVLPGCKSLGRPTT